MNSHMFHAENSHTLLLSILGVFAAQTSRETCQASSHALTDFSSSHQSIAPIVTWHHTVLRIALTCCHASYKHAHSLSNNLTCTFPCDAASSYLTRFDKKNLSYLNLILMCLKATVIGCCFYQSSELTARGHRVSPCISSANYSPNTGEW